MSRLITGVACAVAASAATALADMGLPDDTARSIYRVEAAYTAPPPGRFSGGRAAVVQLVRDEAIRQGVDPNVALKIAYVESRFNPNATGPRTRHGQARGVLQVIPASAESLEPGSSRYLHNAHIGVRVGIRHMARCMAMGANSADQIALCHVQGRPGAPVNRYAASYVHMVRAAPVVGGWLSRGPGSLNVAGLN